MSPLARLLVWLVVLVSSLVVIDWWQPSTLVAFLLVVALAAVFVSDLVRQSRARR